MKEFSIIVPIYNVEGFLPECIDSVINQTFQNFELILVDDGSPDMSGEICDEYAKKDARIKVIHKENGGLADARNAGFGISCGEYIVFLDSDDKMAHLDALTEIHQLLEENQKPDILLKKYSMWDYIGNSGTGQYIMHELLKRAHFNCAVWNKIYKREFLINYSLPFMKGYVHEDIFWSPIVMYNAKKCILADIDFYYHRTNNDSITRTTNEKGVLNRAVSKLNVTYACVKYFSDKELNREFRKDIYEYLIGQYVAGLFEGIHLKEEKSKGLFERELKRTGGIVKYFKDTDRYKYFIIPCKVFGIRFVEAYYKLKFIHKKESS